MPSSNQRKHEHQSRKGDEASKQAEKAGQESSAGTGSGSSTGGGDKPTPVKIIGSGESFWQDLKKALGMAPGTPGSTGSAGPTSSPGGHQVGGQSPAPASASGPPPAPNMPAGPSSPYPQGGGGGGQFSKTPGFDPMISSSQAMEAATKQIADQMKLAAQMTTQLQVDAVKTMTTFTTAMQDSRSEETKHLQSLVSGLEKAYSDQRKQAEAILQEFKAREDEGKQKKSQTGSQQPQTPAAQPPAGGRTQQSEGGQTPAQPQQDQPQRREVAQPHSEQIQPQAEKKAELPQPAPQQPERRDRPESPIQAQPEKKAEQPQSAPQQIQPQAEKKIEAPSPQQQAQPENQSRPAPSPQDTPPQQGERQTQEQPQPRPEIQRPDVQAEKAAKSPDARQEIIEAQRAIAEREAKVREPVQEDKGSGDQAKPNDVPVTPIVEGQRAISESETQAQQQRAEQTDATRESDQEAIERAKRSRTDRSEQTEESQQRTRDDVQRQREAAERLAEGQRAAAQQTEQTRKSEQDAREKLAQQRESEEANRSKTTKQPHTPEPEHVNPSAEAPKPPEPAKVTAQDAQPAKGPQGTGAPKSFNDFLAMDAKDDVDYEMTGWDPSSGQPHWRYKPGKRQVRSWTDLKARSNYNMGEAIHRRWGMGAYEQQTADQQPSQPGDQPSGKAGAFESAPEFAEGQYDGPGIAGSQQSVAQSPGAGGGGGGGDKPPGGGVGGFMGGFEGGDQGQGGGGDQQGMGSGAGLAGAALGNKHVRAHVSKFAAGLGRGGLGAGLKAIPAVGWGVAAAEGINKGAEWMVDQRAQNARYQSIYGAGGQEDPSGIRGNLAGAGQRLKEEGHVLGQRFSGGMDEQSSRELSQGVAATGATEAQGNRQGAMNFGEENFRKLGMSVKSSMDIINTAIGKGITSFGSLGKSLQNVSAAAVNTGQSAETVRQNFSQNFQAATQGSFGNASGAVAEAATLATTGQNKSFQGFDQSRLLNDPILQTVQAGNLGMTRSQFQEASEDDPRVAAKAQDDMIKQMSGGGLSGSVKSASDKYIQEQGGGNREAGLEKLRNDQNLQNQHAEILRKDPNYSTDQAKVAVEASGIDTAGKSDEEIDRLYINSVTSVSSREHEANKQQDAMKPVDLQGADQWTGSSNEIRALQDTGLGGVFTAGGRQGNAVAGALKETNEKTGQNNPVLNKAAEQFGKNPDVSYEVKVAGGGSRVVDQATAFSQFSDQMSAGTAVVRGPGAGDGEGKPLGEVTGAYNVDERRRQEEEGGAASSKDEKLKEEGEDPKKWGEDPKNQAKPGEEGGAGGGGKVEIAPTPELLQMFKFNTSGNAQLQESAEHGLPPESSQGIVGGL